MATPATAPPEIPVFPDTADSVEMGMFVSFGTEFWASFCVVGEGNARAVDAVGKITPRICVVELLAPPAAGLIDVVGDVVASTWGVASCATLGAAVEVDAAVDEDLEEELPCPCLASSSCNRGAYPIESIVNLD